MPINLLKIAFELLFIIINLNHDGVNFVSIENVNVINRPLVSYFCECKNVIIEA